MLIHGIRAYRLAMVLGAIMLVLFLIGCTPGSSNSSNSSAGGGQIAGVGPILNPDDPLGSGSNPNDPGNDPSMGDSGGRTFNQPDETAAVPEPATGMLFLCAAGAAALARIRARKRA